MKTVRDYFLYTVLSEALSSGAEGQPEGPFDLIIARVWAPAPEVVKD
jgi:hypothetical protein